ncbi:hypothetical protein FC83_GL000029 [Agrilactobacillus composti DSM 18527 = JCM 14202]|uniref:Plasmid pRiA4b Orf3-like domain-containing protein n=1 Tax=Agrilactobacillus composti DSM 18527 = JCM 14202 TaxID=1423734 RepID=X0PGV9_9LACO|nr:plasmid pRiA4b ORF-3 family protein [Agrilactobacillus composti]KRM36131.1 hypothetical protein FC83_GL000029 [Agrilactobacillus composti DSM 18527 = JCM 14202]GAF41304.1 hypothetical protein JCM14202_3237 [Agrilactobacillus composti DSM 18527 = JCM 14202]
MAEHKVIRFYAELKYFEPKIWRRFEINGEKTLAELGYTVMAMFEMAGEHLFNIKALAQENIRTELSTSFSEDQIQKFMAGQKNAALFKDTVYELPNVDDDRPIGGPIIYKDATATKLNQVATNIGAKFLMTYDFGDGWEIELKIESIDKREVSLTTLPKVLEGKGYGIIEDVGGPGGLAAMAAAFKKGSGDDYDQFSEWLGEPDFDLSQFDLVTTNEYLRDELRQLKKGYEQ